MNQPFQAEKATEQIVGYDARDYSDDYESLWPLQRREQFLYRFDVKKVLSVDARVWPTIFATVGRPVRPDQAAMQDLWAYAQSLQKLLSEAASITGARPFRTIAVTFVDDGTKSVHPTVEQIAALVDPSEISQEWQFVGFDVADGWLLSALANCGFLAGYDDVAKLRQEWAPHLNEFHLFRELRAASAFRQMSNERLASDHAPTFVYSIRIIK